MSIYTIDTAKIKPGTYTGYITEVNENESNGTLFVNFTVTIERKRGDDISLVKGFVANEGRNQKFLTFMKSLGIVRNNQADTDDALNLPVEVTVIRDRWGESKISTIFPLVDDDDDADPEDDIEGEEDPDEEDYEPEDEDDLYDDFDFEEDDEEDEEDDD